MIQGTTSDAGKSLVAAALCRILSKKGIRVAPFKGQNMALNSFATLDGGEIGRAQALQAEAAGIEPTVDMNPVLLKPTGNATSQVIVRGKPQKTLTARDYYREKSDLVEIVRNSLDLLREEYDVVIIEGAGSPAEINLRDEDIANMGVAKMADSPVLLVGDIDRGGVFASLVGTLELLDDSEKRLVKGLIINKFRGDATLLDPGIAFLRERTGLPFLGTIPYIADLKIDSEDSLAFDGANFKKAHIGLLNEQDNKLDIAVIKLPHISNFTDTDALSNESCVNLRYIELGSPIGKTDCIIIPGTKSTIADLQQLKETGTAAEIVALYRRFGVPVIGICGGYQMLGRSIEDPYLVESRVASIKGLGLLDCKTVMTENKVTEQVAAEIRTPRVSGILKSAEGLPVDGYEIHMGETIVGPGSAAAINIIKRGNETCAVCGGVISPDGAVLGTYLHGLFDNDGLRKAIINYLAKRKGITVSGDSVSYREFKNAQIDRLASIVESSLDMEYVFGLLDPAAVKA
jgi:adenosylcobyric acid synthase